ncbi:MAG: hypothetical protein Kow0042_04470 [Calditrichia bacterium]
MAKCNKCGASVPDKARFCPECGAPQKTRKQASGSFSHNVIYIVTLLSLIIVAVYGYRYIKLPKNSDPHVHSENIPAEQPPVLNQKMFNELKSRLDANPEGVSENIEMGNFLFDHQRFEEALQYYGTALKTDSTNVNVIVDAGVCYFNLRNFEKAREYFQKALSINAEHPNALYNMGVVFAQLGNMEEMLHYWNQLIEVAPESGPAQTAKRMIDDIRQNQTTN